MEGEMEMEAAVPHLWNARGVTLAATVAVMARMRRFTDRSTKHKSEHRGMMADRIRQKRQNKTMGCAGRRVEEAALGHAPSSPSEASYDEALGWLPFLVPSFQILTRPRKTACARL